MPLRHPSNLSIPIRQLINLLETDEVGTWRYTPGADEAEWSDGAFRLHGMVPGVDHPKIDVILHGDVVHPSYRERLFNAVGRVADGEDEEFEMTYQVLLPDQNVRWIRAQGQIQKGSGIFLGTSTDVTREVQLEHARLAAEARSQVLFSESPSPMFVFGPGVRIDAVDEALGIALGRSPSELLNRRLEDLVVPDDVASVREHSARLTPRERHVSLSSVGLLAKRGRVVRCSIGLWADPEPAEDLAGVGIVHLTR